MTRIEKYTIWFSGISIFVSIAVAIFSVAVNLYEYEVKSFFGEEEIAVTISNEMRIGNTIRGIIFNPEIFIENTGYKKVIIETIFVGISKEIIQNHNLQILNYQYDDKGNSPSSFVLKPSYFSKFRLVSTKKLIESERIDRSRLGLRMTSDLSFQYIKEKELNKKIFLKDSIHDDIKNQLLINAEHFKPGKYYLYIGVNTKDNKNIWDGVYSFEIYDHVYKALTEYQPESYKVPERFGNKFMKFYMEIRLKNENDKSILGKLRAEFSK